jgi:hypothetical protein
LSSDELDTAEGIKENACDIDFTFLATETKIPISPPVPGAILPHELESDVHCVDDATVEDILNHKFDSKVPNCKPYKEITFAPVERPFTRSTELRTGESKENTSRTSDCVRSTLK